MVYSYLLIKSSIDFESKIGNKPLANLEYNYNFNKLDLETSMFDRTNYRNDEVFKLGNLFSNSFKLNCDLTEDPETDYKDDKVFECGNFIFGNFEAVCRNLLLINSHLIENQDNTISILNFDIIQSSLPLKLVAIDTNFLMSVTK